MVYVLLVVLALALVGCGVRLWLLWRPERHQEPAAPSFDLCEVCSVPLDDRTAWRLYGDMRTTVVDGVPAGSYMSADYCEAHAPEGAIDPRGAKAAP